MKQLTTHWQLSTYDSLDQITQGLDDISACIFNILSTRKGTDILRPEFGSDHFDYIDQPSDIAMPGIVKEVSSAIARWEKRILIDDVTIIDLSPTLDVTISWHVKDDVAREIYTTVVTL